MSCRAAKVEALPSEILIPHHKMSLYFQAIETPIKHLRNFSKILDKAKKFADEKGIEHNKLLTYRLVEDQRGLIFQVQACCNTAKFSRSRLAGYENVYMEDDETTFEQLQTRISKTIQALQSVEEKSLEGREHQPVLMETRSNGNFKFETAQQYVSEYATPYFHFHYSTAYCILRHLGVPLGALDYLGDDTFVEAEQ